MRSERELEIDVDAIKNGDRDPIVGRRRGGVCLTKGCGVDGELCRLCAQLERFNARGQEAVEVGRDS